MGPRLQLFLPTVVLTARVFAVVLLLVVEQWEWPQQRRWKPHCEA
jgi:hypothetical protein